MIEQIYTWGMDVSVHGVQTCPFTRLEVTQGARERLKRCPIANGCVQSPVITAGVSLFVGVSSSRGVS